MFDKPFGFLKTNKKQTNKNEFWLGIRTQLPLFSEMTRNILLPFCTMVCVRVGIPIIASINEYKIKYQPALKKC